MDKDGSQVIRTALWLTICWVSATVCAAATITVDLNGAGDFTEIQPAIDAAMDGDTVLVKPGEYVITEPVTFKGKAITVRGKNGAEETTVRMFGNLEDRARGSVVIFENGEEGASVLEGLKLTGAKAGGVTCKAASSPTLKGCTISENTAISGGGFLCTEGSSPTLMDCTISRNSAQDSTNGGGACHTATHTGGGVSCVGDGTSPMLVNCTISENSAVGVGGGVHCTSGSSPNLTNCTISGNSGFTGGGVRCEESAARLTNCTISGNSSFAGSGVSCYKSSPTLTNCRISGNLVRDFIRGEKKRGGGVSCTSGSSPILTNCTISGNSADVGGGVSCADRSSPTVTNCILSGNLGGSIAAVDGSAPQVTFSCVEGEELWPGEGNVNTDPLFEREGIFNFERVLEVEIGGQTFELPDSIVEAPDYRLRPGSPCIDAGNTVEAPETDIEGNARPCGDGVDMGAYESDCPSPAFLRSDCNDDADVDISDALCILDWRFAGAPAPGCLAAMNVNGDAGINIADAIYLFNSLFLGGPSPVAPFPGCGPGTDADLALGCDTSNCE